MKKVVDVTVMSLLRTLIDPPVSPPRLNIAVTYEGSGEYVSTLPDGSRVTMLNARLIAFDAQIASVEN